MRTDQEALGLTLTERFSEIVLDLLKQGSESVRRGISAAGLRGPLQTRPEETGGELPFVIDPRTLEVDHWRSNLVHSPRALVWAALHPVHQNRSERARGQVAGLRRKILSGLLIGQKCFPVRRNADRINLQLETAEKAKKRNLVFIAHEELHIAGHRRARPGTFR